MDRNDNRAVLCELVSKLRENGSWTGQTHIQKAVYLLKHLVRVPLEYEFRLYKHGPYSFNLRDEVGLLRGGKVLAASAHEPYGLKFEVCDAIRTGAEEKFKREVDFVAKALGKKKVVELEALSTALMVTLEEASDDTQARMKRLLELKPHLRETLANDAIRELDDLRQGVKEMVKA
jgi:uncharacterized protein YwgA